MWILEAQRFNNRGADSVGGKSTGWLHFGYMNIAFPTKRRAAEYYDMHNSHMRGLNAHNTWRSDYDPDTFLRYVVRSYNTAKKKARKSPAKKSRPRRRKKPLRTAFSDVDDALVMAIWRNNGMI